MDLDDFLGNWTLEKVIDDRLSGRPMRFSGIATFSAATGGVRYDEKGEMVLEGSDPLPATRTYIWRTGAHHQIDVFFGDERLFHQFSLSASAHASHFCDPDIYDVLYQFADWPDWSCVWSVKGPKKDYRMEARYLRAD